MKKLPIIALVIALLTGIAGCQSSQKLLSKTDSKNEIMSTIANDSDMAKEMMQVLMESKTGKMMMQENEKMKMMMGKNEMMKKMMKENPGMMKGMMSEMMDMSKGDSTMMSGMCKSMMENKEMMEMMQKMKGEKKDVHKMEGMDNKMKH